LRRRERSEQKDTSQQEKARFHVTTPL